MTSGRRVFQQHTERTEGSDTTPTSHVQKVLRTECKNSNITKLQTDHAAQRGRGACGTATRISASLSRRLSAFFGSPPGQDPKAAKFAVLTPGPGRFVNVRNAPRVVIAPPSETAPVSACKPLCAILLRKPSVYPLSPVKANMGHLYEKLKSGWEQRCDGNFLAIFAGVSIGEKPNFTGGFFEW